MTSNSPEAVINDYEKMADADADVIWAFPTLREAREAIQRLEDAEHGPHQVSSRAARNLSRMQKEVKESDADGMTTVQTFRKMSEEVVE